MATSENVTPASDSGGGLAILYDERVRNVFYQLITFGVVAWASWYLVTNTSENLAARGMNSGFGFINATAGFDTDFKLISYEAGDTYGRIYIVGILNTLFVSVISIVFATTLGFFMGVMRLSPNWLISRLSAVYVEVLRNTPLLLQIVFWYLGVFALLPRPNKSMEVAQTVFLNNRGLYMPTPQFGELFWITAVAMVLALVGAIGVARWAKRRQALTGQQFPTLWVVLGILIILPGLAYLLTGSPLTWDVPAKEGFNFVGGSRLPPAFLALLFSLGIYHSCYMAESVRAGIQSVNKGQTEASSSLGLTRGKTLRLVIIPQAMRAIVPPMISLWMNVVKNSSLAVAIGYPDIVSLFMQTSLNQSGYAIEIVAMTMAFYMSVSLTISFLLNIYNRAVQLKER